VQRTSVIFSEDEEKKRKNEYVCLIVTACVVHMLYMLHIFNLNVVNIN
jgi:hypothetical protein